MAALAKAKAFSVVALVAAGLALVSGVSASAQPQAAARIEKSPQLFAVLCAIHAAGFEDDVSTSGFHPVRRRLAPELRRMKGPAVEAVRDFYRQHRLADPVATLSRYVSYGLAVGPPPRFEFQFPRSELPDDVRALEGFTAPLVDFYREANIESLWQRVQPDYDREVGRLQQPLANVVVLATSYMRVILAPGETRSFTIYVEPLVGAKINLRDYGDHYSLVLSPSAHLPLNEIRHAFLHFLLDPLAQHHRKVVETRQGLLPIAARAPRMPQEYKEDFTLLLTECLVRAVELRLDRLSPTKLEVALAEADRSGFVLVRALFGELARFEQSEPAMNLYFPDLVRGVDVAAETKRLAGVEFTAAPLLSAHVPAPKVEADEARLIRQGEQHIAEQNGVAAAAVFDQLLAQQPGHPHALYGRAVAAVLLGEGKRARELFQQVVQSVALPGAFDKVAAGKGPLILAWSHIYLGRIYDMEGHRELALSEYRAALAVAAAPEAARRAAQRGLQEAFRPAVRNRSEENRKP